MVLRKISNRNKNPYVIQGILLNSGVLEALGNEWRVYGRRSESGLEFMVDCFNSRSLCCGFLKVRMCTWIHPLYRKSP